MKEMTLNASDGTKLYCKEETSPDNRAVAVIVHGLCEHQGRYDYVAEKLQEAGIGTYRFDHRGHGRSEGEDTYYESFHELLDDTNVVVDLAIKEHADIPVFLLGHSMGGFTVSLYGVKYADKGLQGIITTGALTADFQGVIRNAPQNLDPHTKLPNDLGGGICSVKEVGEAYAIDPYNKKTFTTGLCYALVDGLDWFQNKMTDFSYPVFMTHGEKDGIVSAEDTYQFFRNAGSKDKQMKIYGGLFHEILNEYCKDEVLADIVHWMDCRIV